MLNQQNINENSNCRGVTLVRPSHQKSQKNHGITLIALIVTIIILLILVGVVINLISGSEGILNRASNAADTYDLAQKKEEIEIMLAQIKMDSYEQKLRVPTFQELADDLQEDDSIEYIYGNEEYAVLKYKDYYFKVDKNLNVIETLDKLLPNVEVTLSNYEDSLNDIIITIKVLNADEIGGIESIYRKDPLENCKITNNSTTYTVHQNGDYVFCIKGKNDTMYEKTVSIGNIQNINVEYALFNNNAKIDETKYYTNIDIKFNVVSELSNESLSIALPNGESIPGSEATLAVQENGAYQFRVALNNGDSKTFDVNVENILEYWWEEWDTTSTTSYTKTTNSEVSSSMQAAGYIGVCTAYSFSDSSGFYATSGYEVRFNNLGPGDIGKYIVNPDNVRLIVSGRYDVLSRYYINLKRVDLAIGTTTYYKGTNKSKNNAHSTNPSEYPNNEAKGTKWYIYLGDSNTVLKQ